MRFEKGFDRYACEGDTITAQKGKWVATARIYRDDCGDTPDDRSDGFWPSKDKDSAGYVRPENYDAKMANAKRVMAAWRNDEWFYCGIAVTIEYDGVELTDECDAALWGIECNCPGSSNEYLLEVANELLPEALHIAADTLRTLAEADANELE